MSTSCFFGEAGGWLEVGLFSSENYPLTCNRIAVPGEGEHPVHLFLFPAAYGSQGGDTGAKKDDGAGLGDFRDRRANDRSEDISSEADNGCGRNQGAL